MPTWSKWHLMQKHTKALPESFRLIVHHHFTLRLRREKSRVRGNKGLSIGWNFRIRLGYECTGNQCTKRSRVIFCMHRCHPFLSVSSVPKRVRRDDGYRFGFEINKHVHFNSNALVKETIDHKATPHLPRRFSCPRRASSKLFCFEYGHRYREPVSKFWPWRIIKGSRNHNQSF